MKLKYLAVLTMLSILVMISCSKDDEYVEEETKVELEEPMEEESDLIVGTVKDFDDIPVANAMITLSEKEEILLTTFSDENGKYELNTSGLTATKKVLTIEKEGFLTIRKIVEVGPALALSSKMALAVCQAEDSYAPYQSNTDQELIMISGKAINVEGNGAENSRIWVSTTGDPSNPEAIDFLNTVVVDAEGNWESIAPANRAISITVDLGSECNNDARIEVGPFSDDASIPDFTDLNKSRTQVVTASPFNCDNERVQRGMLRYFINGGFETFRFLDDFITDADFTQCHVVCNEDYTHEMFVYDRATNQYNLKRSVFQEELTFGDMMTCTPLESSYELTLDGDPVIVQNSGILSKGFRIGDREEQRSFIVQDAGIWDEGEQYFTFQVAGSVESGKEYTEILRLELFTYNQPMTYANFEGSIRIVDIADGYVLGEINGTVYPSVTQFPSGSYTIDGPSKQIVGTFKCLVIKE